MILVKRFETPTGGLMLAVCDKELRGKTFEDGELQLDCASNFYAGDETESSTAQRLLKNCENANLVGEKSVAAAIAAGIVDVDSVKRIKDVPYVQIVRM